MRNIDDYLDEYLYSQTFYGREEQAEFEEERRTKNTAHIQKGYVFEVSSKRISHNLDDEFELLKINK